MIYLQLKHNNIFIFSFGLALTLSLKMFPLSAGSFFTGHYWCEHFFSLFSNFQQHIFHDVLCNSTADKHSVFKQETFLIYTDLLYTRDNIQLSKRPMFKHRKDDATIRSLNVPKGYHISIWLGNQLKIHSATLFLQ